METRIFYYHLRKYFARSKKLQSSISQQSSIVFIIIYLGISSCLMLQHSKSVLKRSHSATVDKAKDIHFGNALVSHQNLVHLKCFSHILKSVIRTLIMCCDLQRARTLGSFLVYFEVDNSSNHKFAARLVSMQAFFLQEASFVKKSTSQTLSNK